MLTNGAMMRDGSIDYETGWLYDGYYDRVAGDLSSGLGAMGRGRPAVSLNLNRVPPPGRRYIAEALRDPKARPIVLGLLAGSNPSMAMTRQAERDLAESVRPTGKVIVFKSLVSKLAGRLQAAEDAVVRATDPNTEEGRTVVGIVASSSNPKADVQEYLNDVAVAALAPDAEVMVDGPSELGYLGKSLIKRAKAKVKAVLKKPTVKKALQIYKKVQIGAAIAAAAIIVGPAILPAIGGVGSTVIGAVGSIFGAGKPAAPVPEEGAPQPEWDAVRGEWVTPAAAGQQSSTGPDLSAVANVALEVYKLKQTGQVAKAGMLNQQLIEQLKAQGMSESAATALAAQAMAQAERTYGPQEAAATGAPGALMPMPAPASGPAEASIVGSGSDTLKYGMLAFVGVALVYGVAQGIGAGRGGRRSSRRR